MFRCESSSGRAGAASTPPPHPSGHWRPQGAAGSCFPQDCGGTSCLTTAAGAASSRPPLPLSTIANQLEAPAELQPTCSSAAFVWPNRSAQPCDDIKHWRLCRRTADVTELADGRQEPLGDLCRRSTATTLATTGDRHVGRSRFSAASSLGLVRLQRPPSTLLLWLSQPLELPMARPLSVAGAAGKHSLWLALSEHTHYEQTKAATYIRTGHKIKWNVGMRLHASTGCHSSEGNQMSQQMPSRVEQLA